MNDAYGIIVHHSSFGHADHASVCLKHVLKDYSEHVVAPVLFVPHQDPPTASALAQGKRSHRPGRGYTHLTTPARPAPDSRRYGCPSGRPSRIPAAGNISEHCL